MFTFKKHYFFLAILLFLVEVFIALFVKDAFIRPIFGDFLVVILLYCFARAFWKQSPWVIAICVLIFAYCIEFGQAMNLINILGLEDYKLARIVIGTSFSWEDMIAYTLGVITAYMIDKRYGH